MSLDDMVFDDVQYREPARLVRPDRDVRFACVAYSVPGAGELPIFVDHRAADVIERHALSDTSVELGGVLIGKECVDSQTGEPFVWITHSLEAKHYANTQASFTYTHDSWEEMTREREKHFPDLDIVGWYHTHPSFGIFLSHHDLFIHQHFFSQRLQVAYVVDPIQQSRGFFQWRDGAMVQVGGYWLVGDRTERVALVKLVNDLENVQDSTGSGSGLISPRLEAELIRMLNRPTPTYSTTSPSERAQIAVLFAMLGAMLGVVGIGVAFWLYQLGAQARDQAQAIAVLSQAVEASTDRQRLMSSLLLDQTKGGSSTDLVERYTKLLKTHEEQTRRLDSQIAVDQTLASRSRELESRLNKATTELEIARKDAQDAPKLRERLAELEDTAKTQKSLLENQAAVIESVEGKQTQELLERLSQFRYLAYLGWGLCAVLGIALAAVPFLIRPRSRETPEPGSTHRIS